MKILVTGRRGQVAQSLAECAAAYPTADLAFLGRPNLDLAIPGSAAAIVRDVMPDVIINAAAYTAVDQAEDEPELAFRTNADAAGELAQAGNDIGARVIQLSTDYVFDGCATTPYQEDDPTRPLNVYGASKLLGEQKVKAANPKHAVIRSSWIVSPFGRNFVKTIMSAARTSDTLTVVSDQRGTPTSARDLAEGLLRLLEAWRDGAGEGSGGIYHLAGQEIVSWFGFAQAIMDECGRRGLPCAEVRPIHTTDWPTKAARPPCSALDSSKFGRDFGFTMPSWRDSLPALVERIAREP